MLCARMGSTESLGALLRRYRAPLLIVARGITRSVEAAEDIVQESLLAAQQSLSQLRDPRRFGSWLYSITRYRALRYVEAQKRPPASVSLDAGGEDLCGPDPRADPAHGYERAETSRELREAIEQLPPDYRIAIELRYWDGLDMAGIAQLSSVPVSTVKWRLYAAKQALEKALKGRSGR